MYVKKIRNIAIITARKGSKRIKNKNIKIFFGKPIIYYSIKALQKSKIFDLIIVSTNCDKIEKISRKYGIKNIIRRPNYISSNKVGTITVVNHAIKNLLENKISPKFVCCLYPAAPLVKYKNIIFSYKQLKKQKKLNYVYPSIDIRKKKIKSDILKLIKINKIKKKEGIINNNLLDAGQFWYAKTKTWIRSKTIYNKNSYTFLIKEKYSDINVISDWKIIKKIYSKNKNEYIN